jgi:hypothetical protein
MHWVGKKSKCQQIGLVRVSNWHTHTHTVVWSSEENNQFGQWCRINSLFTVQNTLLSISTGVLGIKKQYSAIGRAADTQMWLSTVPTDFNGSLLGNQEFQDGL